MLLAGLDDAQTKAPLFLRGDVPVSLEAPAGALRVLVFADGKPMNDLSEGAFGSPSSAASLSEAGFFSGQRRRVFLDGMAQTAELGSVIVYVATTGHGLVPIDRHVPHYNVPGEKALASDAWVRAHQASVREHLAHLREQQPEAPLRLVYYAGKSKKGFRNMLWSAVYGWVQDDRREGRTAAAAMYGARQHVKGWDGFISHVFEWLDSSGRTDELPPWLERWQEQHRGVSAFAAVTQFLLGLH